jgi:hypothetical protein
VADARPVTRSPSSASTGFTLTCLSAPPSGFPPLVRGATIPAGLPRTTVPSFLASVIPVGAPPGNYVLFLALTRPNALGNAQLDSGELLAFTSRGFAIVP